MYINDKNQAVTVTTVLNKTNLSDEEKLKIQMEAFHATKKQLARLEMLRKAKSLDIRRTVRPRFSFWKFITGQLYSKRQQKFELADGTFIWKDIDTNVFEDEIEEE